MSINEDLIKQIEKQLSELGEVKIYKNDRGDIYILSNEEYIQELKQYQCENYLDIEINNLEHRLINN